MCTESVNYFPQVLPLIGVALGFVGGFLSNLYFERRRNKELRKSLSAAIVGEIQAIVSVLKLRKYKDAIIGYIEAIHETGEADYFTVDINQDYLTIFEKNADKIGFLGADLAAKISKFYIMTRSLLEDAISLQHGWLSKADADQLLHTYDGMIQLIDQLENEAQEIARLAGNG